MPRRRAQRLYRTTRTVQQTRQNKYIGRGSEERDRLKEKEGESLSGGTRCLYSPRLLKQTCTSQEGKLTWLMVLLDVCIITHMHLQQVCLGKSFISNFHRVIPWAEMQIRRTERPAYLKHCTGNVVFLFSFSKAVWLSQSHSFQS